MSSVVDGFMEFFQTSGWGGGLVAIILIIFYIVIKKMTADLYDVTKSILREKFSRKEHTIEAEGSEFKSTDCSHAEDWSKARVALELLKWLVGFGILILFIKLPYLFLRPIFWSTAEICLYFYIISMNLYFNISLSTMKFMFPDIVKEVIGSYGSRKNEVKTVMSYAVIVLSIVLLTETLNNRYVYNNLARQYCLNDLPGLTDRYTVSLRLGVPINEVSEEQVRDSMRNPLAEELISSGTCNR